MDKNTRKVDDVQIIHLSVELCLLLLKFIKIIFFCLAFESGSLFIECGLWKSCAARVYLFARNYFGDKQLNDPFK
jgi:hypothetical protein